MDFSLTEEQSAVQELARKILTDLASNDRIKQLETEEPVFDHDLWRELAKANLLGVAIGETYGGNGMGFFTLCILLEEIGRSVAPVPLLPTLAFGALPIERFGSDAQKQRWLPAVTRGEVVLTAALHEAGCDDSTRPQCEARPDGDGFRLSGEKILVPAAQVANAVLVPARTAGGKACLFLVEAGREGVSIEPQRATDRQPHALLRLEAAPVGRDALLGSEESGAEVLAWLTHHATTALCAVQLGVSDRALSMTAEYAKERVQFERPIGSFQAVHQRAADAYIQLQAMRLTTWDAAWRLEAGEVASDAVQVAKYWAAEGGQFVGYAAQHLHGGIGIDVDYPMHRYYLWAKQCELSLGSAPVQLERIGMRLAEGELAGDVG
jgi:alkylation response protein AidB-like acyl-CoA dehydrogenase